MSRSIPSTVLLSFAPARADISARLTVQSTHHTFSDFPLLTPTLPSLPFASPSPSTLTASPAALIGTIVSLSEAFLLAPLGGFADAAEELGVKGLNEQGAGDQGRVEIVVGTPDKKGKTKRRIEGEAGGVRVHDKAAD